MPSHDAQTPSPSVQQIARGAARAMFWAKMRVAALVIAAVGLAGGGTYLVMRISSGPTAATTATAAPAAPANVARSDAEEVDWNSPLSVAAASVRFAMAPDPQKLRETFYGENADEERLADAMTEVFANAQELNDLGKARFGPEGSIGPISSREDMPKVDAKLWQTKVDGDTAVVTMSPGLKPRVQYLGKIGGKWKVNIYKTFAPVIDRRLPAAGVMADRMAATAVAMSRTASELLAGKFANVDEARQFLKEQSSVKPKPEP